MRFQVPKEHGAWGMVGLPLAAGLALGGRWDAAAATTVVMVFFAYVARAPLEAFSRGRRDGETVGWLAADVLIACLCAALLLFAWQRTAWLAAVLVLCPALAVTLAFASRRHSRELLNELIGAVVLPVSGLVAHAVAVDRIDRLGLLLWLAFALYNAVTVPYIRTWVMTRRAEKNERFAAEAAAMRQAAAWSLAAGTALVLALAASGVWTWLAAAAWLPGAVRIVRGLPRAGRVEVPIKTIGWMEMAHATVFAVLLTTGLWRL